MTCSIVIPISVIASPSVIVLSVLIVSCDVNALGKAVLRSATVFINDAASSLATSEREEALREIDEVEGSSTRSTTSSSPSVGVAVISWVPKFMESRHAAHPLSDYLCTSSKRASSTHSDQ